MDVREKLIEILKKPIFPHEMVDPIEAVADYLLDSGVTVQEWVSVKDGLPESGKESVLIALRWGEVDIGWCEDGRWRSEFVNEYEEGEVTHWMLLPQPPKGVNDGESVD